MISKILRVVPTLLLLGVAAVLWPSSLGGATSYVKVSGTSMLPKLHTGDLVATRTATHYRTGDVVAYRIPNGQIGAGLIVIHRIVGGDPRHGFITRGDNRTINDSWHPKASDILGEKWIVIPRVGNAMNRLRSPAAIAAFATTLAVLAAISLTSKRRPDPVPTTSESAASPPDLILVIDDEDAFRHSVARMLTHSGYDVVEAADAKSVLHAFNDHRTPTLVLSDVVMPDLSGTKLAKELATIGGPPTLLMSGHADAATDAFPFLRKPFLEADLIDLVHSELTDTTRPV